MDKATLLQLVKDRQSISIRGIHKHLGIDPTNEDDRPKVWKVGQGLADLVHFGFIHMQTSTGERVFYDF